MIPFTSIENFYEECTTGIEFKYNEKWYLVEFDDPFKGIGTVRIHLQDDNDNSYTNDNFCFEYCNLETLVHNYKIGDRTLAEIICDENSLPRNKEIIKRKLQKWQLDLFNNGPYEK